MFDRHHKGEQATLVHINFRTDRNLEDLGEFLHLVKSAGAKQIELLKGVRNSPDPKYFVGRGKAAEIRQRIADNGADLVVFNHELTPGQERNLERLCQCRVIDRTGIILDIFAQRARSHEGKLQVELAQLRYLSTRLIRGWGHLERQKGGIGLRGPGETQLETDRRLISQRIKQIRKRLQKVHKQRTQSRLARNKAAVPTLAVVGYTNAGKSSVFNALTGACVYSADQLFATLDPTLRQFDLPNKQRVVLADTVGFIRHLPHDLISAFRATLQETLEADLLLHVVDVNDVYSQVYRQQVDQVLADIGAQDIPQLFVFNKIDLLEAEPRIDRDENQQIKGVWISAKTGAGLDLLVQAMADRFKQETVHGWLKLSPQAGRTRARLFEIGAVLRERVDDFGGCRIEVKMSRRHFEEFSKQEDFEGSMIANRAML